jgi:hypothetical protein
MEDPGIAAFALFRRKIHPTQTPHASAGAKVCDVDFQVTDCKNKAARKLHFVH